MRVMPAAPQQDVQAEGGDREMGEDGTHRYLSPLLGTPQLYSSAVRSPGSLGSLDKQTSSRSC
jgi:hypothetical protein